MAEKFRIGLPETAFPFIPPADKFLEYLGRPGGLARMINELGARLNQPLPGALCGLAMIITYELVERVNRQLLGRYPRISNADVESIGE